MEWSTLVKSLDKANTRLETELNSVSREVLHRFPLADYLNDVKSSHRRSRLTSSSLARKRTQIFEKISSEYGRHTLSRYLKLALSFFMVDSLKRLNCNILPSEILRLYHEWFERILGDFSTQPDKYYHYRCLSFAANVKVCSLRYFPVGGAWIVETRSIGLRPFLDGGAMQFFDYFQYVTLKAGGFSRYYSMHTTPQYIRRFNEREINLAYLRIADLMKTDPGVKGIYNRSWYLDPNIENISPKLTYLRQVPLQNSAKFFAAGTTKDDVKHALTMSFVRQRLHDEGKYTPTAYAFIWPRNTFLDWADKPDVRALIKSENDKSDNARAASYTEKGRRVASKIAAI